jgi:hypothetical protein
LPVALVVAVSLRGRGEIKLRESGAATMSALNLWNKNTERVADALSRDNKFRIGQESERTLTRPMWHSGKLVTVRVEEVRVTP